MAKKWDRMDFNTLYWLYKSWGLDNWRILLFYNMNRFITDSRINIWDDSRDKYDDIHNDLFLKIDERLLKSVEEWFENKQAFSYIRKRARWFMLNSQDVSRDKEKYVKCFTELEWTEYDVYNIEDYTQLIKLDMFWNSEWLLDAILSLSDKHRSIMLLKYMSWENYKINDIAKHIWRSQYETLCEHEQALVNIKNILQLDSK